MKFIVKRTSSRYPYEKPPCKEAARETITRTETYPHRTITTQEHAWVLEIPTLDDLITFVKGLDDTDEIVIAVDTSDPYPTLEIYDYWRE